MSKPTIWMLDYKADYTPEMMRRLVDCGIDTIWLFDQAVNEQHLAPGKFNFRVTVPYVARAKAAGIKTVYVQSPIGIADWIPDEWALQNGLGDYSTLRGPFYNEKQCKINLSGEAFAHRSVSYWNPEAEAETQAYVAAMRKAVEPDAIVVGALANCGEYFFPSHYYASDHGRLASAWYFDPHAQASYEKSGMSRDAWWRRERKAILLRRFSWYSERWTAFYEDHPRKSWARGTVDIADTLKTFDPRPKTIRFCGMQELTGTLEQVKHFITYCGAEGTANVLENTRKIIDGNLGVAGLLCGLLSIGTGDNRTPDDEAYRQLKLAVEAR